MLLKFLQHCFIIKHKGDALIVGIYLQVIIFLVGADMEKYMTDGHLDTLRGYNMHNIISISKFVPHPPITAICVGCCSVSLSL